MAAPITNNILRIFLIWAMALTAVAALGFDGLNCGTDPTKIVAPCDHDCKQNHNAKHGFCKNVSDGDFTCFCTQPMKALNHKAQQCLNATNPRFDAVCRVDCLCNHAALSSKCDYEAHACVCLGQSENMDLCPMKSKLEMLTFIREQDRIAKEEARGTYHCN